MDGDFEALTRINMEITAAEDRGDANALVRHFAPTLAFRRANGDVVSLKQFLEGVTPGGPRILTIQSIALLGQHRAFVSCVVSMPVGGQVKSFDNARLFVRSDGQDWKLLGWANELAPPS